MNFLSVGFMMIVSIVVVVVVLKFPKCLLACLLSPVITLSY